MNRRIWGGLYMVSVAIIPDWYYDGDNLGIIKIVMISSASNTLKRIFGIQENY